MRMAGGIMLVGLALSVAACGRGSDAGANASHIEAMGPDGGSNVTTTPPPAADTAPVGAADNGNVAPGDVNPAMPRDGNATTGNNQ